MQRQIPCRRSIPQPAAEPLTRSTSATPRSKPSPRPSAAWRAASAAIVTSAPTACQANAIDYGRKRRHHELKVGAIVLAPGYEIFDAAVEAGPGLRPLPERAHGSRVRADSVRLRTLFRPCAASLRPAGAEADRLPPVRWFARLRARLLFVASAACMPPRKRIIAKEHVGEGVQCDIFFMDLRAFGKGFEQYYQRAQELGVRYIRSRVPKIEEVAGTRNLIVTISRRGRQKSSPRNTTWSSSRSACSRPKTSKRWPNDSAWS